MNHDPQSAELERPREPALLLPWLVAPAVAVLVALLVVGIATLLLPSSP